LKQRLSDLRGGGSRPTTGQCVDPAIHAAVTNAASDEPSEPVCEIANQVRGHGFDIPPSAEALRGHCSGLRLSIRLAIDRRSSATAANTRSLSAGLSRTGSEYPFSFVGL
jgi:hypothetical protein